VVFVGRCPPYGRCLRIDTRPERSDLMSESDSRVRCLVPETPDGTDRQTVRPDVPGTPRRTLERAVATVLDRKDIPVVAACDSAAREFVTSHRFYRTA
jgi:hypothetical protein